MMKQRPPLPGQRGQMAIRCPSSFLSLFISVYVSIETFWPFLKLSNGIQATGRGRFQDTNGDAAIWGGLLLSCFIL